MKFFTIIGRNALYTYENNGQKYDLQYIEGSEAFPVSLSSVKQDIESYLEALADEKNLSTTAVLEFEILEGADKFCNSGIMNELGDRVVKQYPLNDALQTVIRKLSRDRSLMIEKYGINYDGYSYKDTGEGPVQSDFDLLAHTIHSSDVMDMIDIR